MSDFDGLRIALSSLYAQRKALQVTGQNIANVNTEGYSRQRVELIANAGPSSPAIESHYTGAGMGVLAGASAAHDASGAYQGDTGTVTRTIAPGVKVTDLPAAVVDLQLQEVAYQAALGATAKALQPSLMDFLR